MFMLTDNYLYECLIRKRTSEIAVKCFVFFTFFNNLFYENINQEHNLQPECAFEPFTYVCCENCMAGFSVSFLT